jgi:hypothetical protein
MSPHILRIQQDYTINLYISLDFNGHILKLLYLIQHFDIIIILIKLNPNLNIKDIFFRIFFQLNN